MSHADERAVVVKAPVAPAFVMVEPQLPFELSIVEFDHPAQPGQAGEAAYSGLTDHADRLWLTSGFGRD